MDLSAYSLQKLNREKRERQPNWTESEKQMLLSLTRIHQSILENKSSDTMTIKRKSEAWDEIGMRMKAAGFNRSKERLKQQLGRIRAAEAKKIKDAIERNLAREHGKSVNISTNITIEKNTSSQMTAYINGDEYDAEIQHISTKSTSLPVHVLLPEQHCIKTENTPSIEDNECSGEEQLKNTKTNVSNCTILNTFKDNSNENDSKVVDNMHFMLQTVQSLAEKNCNVNTDIITNGGIIEAKAANAIDVTSTILCPTASSNINNSSINLKDNHIISRSGNEENTTSCNSAAPKKRRLRCSRSRPTRTSFTRDQGLRQLYMYRVAVERERLRSLKLQQKRDRILYRKDVEIQNLKLQILRNLTNQNRDSNRINL
ncbi:uncharacterized protein LOC135949018 isoform X2 [Calliphora vicina]|uniref:uncharacterized protein LOC135949018 isoform X2 n=1 Tax=Calliphora vicina TaxID=7373 RepID=UPI00325AE323